MYSATSESHMCRLALCTETSILIPLLLLNFNMRLHGNPTAWYLFLATERTHAHRTRALTPTLFSSAEHNIQSTLLVISRWVWAYTPATSWYTRHSPQPTGTRSHLATQDHGSRGLTTAGPGRTYNHTKILHARYVFWCPYAYRQVFLTLEAYTK